MEKKILIVKNITREGPGILQSLMEEKKIPYDIVDLDKGESFPSVEGYSAIVVLGGPDSANDATAKIEEELKRIKKVTDLKIPYLGICLGLQTLVKANGGKVVRAENKEIGFLDPNGNSFTIQLTDSGRSDPLFKDLDDPFKVFHLHGETVELTDEMELLGTGEFCKNQIVRINNNAYGIQCHFELTPEMFQLWINQDPELMEMDRNDLEREFSLLREEYTETGKRLFENFLEIAGF